MKLKKISTIISLSLVMTCSAAMADSSTPKPSKPEVTNANVTDSQGHGSVTFKGAIVEAPCSIAPDSVDQTVQLGQVSTAQLKNNGTSSPRQFDIKLEGCDIKTKKSVTTKFEGTAEGENLALMGGTASGASIVIQNSDGTPFKINKGFGTAAPLEASVTTLHYSAFLKAGADKGKIKTGDFTSVVTFDLNYQ